MASDPQTNDEPAKLGRPTWYRDEYVDQVHKLALLGQTDDEMAETLGVSGTTFERWKAKKPHFRLAIARGRAPADADVAFSLYNRAKGFSYTATKVFPPTKDSPVPVTVEYQEFVPGETAAASLWLRNRQGGKWREKTDVVHSGTISLEAWVLESLPAPEPQQARVIEGEAVRVEGEPDDAAR